MNILIFGPQGSGKSTQAQLLSQKLGWLVLSAGDVSREIGQEKSARGRITKEYLSKGELTPDEIIGPEMAKRLLMAEEKGGFISDGWPRTLAQIKLTPFKIDVIFLVNVSQKVSIKRLLERGRPDDTLPVIKERLKIYWQETKPVIEYYKGLGIPVFTINGEQSIKEVQEEILEKLNQI